MKRITFILSVLIIVFVLTSGSYAGLFKNTVPTGKEIKDPYLEQLFAPEFPYESVKVIETKEGKRYVVIKAKETVNDKMRLDYEKNTLRNRGIVIFQSGSPRTNILLISEMRLYRKVSEMPYVVEYCEAKGKLERKLGEVESVVRNEGKHLIILVSKDFGKVFKRVEIYPEKDAGCPEPPFVGKYPNARSISCTEKNKWITFVYITKDKAEDIYNYYKDKLKSHYKKVGFNFPEKSWKGFGEFGMEISSTEINRWKDYLEREKKDYKSIKSSPPSNGVVFHIVIEKLGMKPIIEDYSFIIVSYSLDQELIKKNIERMKRLYPEGVQ